jgi:ferric-dicitrate binding protein FerR (iron transport regulator)
MKNRTGKIMQTAITAALIVTLALSATACGKNLTASTMRLLRREGTVHLFDNDKEKTISDNLRLNSGNKLNTEAKSLVGIALDDTKVVTIDEQSSATFDQNGKKLDINLTQGSLFFEVTKKLDADETFDIRTSTMVVGIRGTSGYVSVDEGGHEVVYITDGSVEVIGTNPTTGETKTITGEAGQRVTTYLYNDRTVDSIMFELEDVAEEDLNEFVLERLREDDTLVEVVCADTGWSVDKIMGADGTDVMTASAAGTSDQDQAASSESTESAVGDDVTTSTDAQDSTVAGASAASTEASDASAEASSAEQPRKSNVSQYIVSTDANGVYTLTTGQHFDPNYYASQNPDVVAEIGSDPEALLEHFLAFGTSENRYGSAQDKQAAEEARAQEYLEFQKALSRAEAEAAEKARAAAAAAAAAAGDGGGGSVSTPASGGSGGGTSGGTSP